jgi:dienelactone hydrolase
VVTGIVVAVRAPVVILLVEGWEGFGDEEHEANTSALSAAARKPLVCRRRTPEYDVVLFVFASRLIARYLAQMVTSRDITYSADDRTLIGTLVLPESSDPRPGVLVCHEGPGLDDGTRGRAVRLAELGYVAFALDYHGDGVPLTDRAAMMARLGELSAEPLRTRALASAGLDVLLAEPRTDRSKVASIGYCFGGTMTFELARSGADLLAAVGFHAGLRTTRPDDAVNIRAKVLALIGADDPMVPIEQRQDFEEEMRAGQVDWVLQIFGGAQHSFTNPAAKNIDLPGIAYHESTDRRSWKAMLDLFDEVFGPMPAVG